MGCSSVWDEIDILVKNGVGMIRVWIGHLIIKFKLKIAKCVKLHIPLMLSTGNKMTFFFTSVTVALHTET